jgi:hypothetical protein
MKSALIFICLCLYLTAFSQEKRLALVIGNGKYEYGGTLANPENDAKAIGQKLRELGFEVFEYVNLDQKSMKMSIDNFGVKLKNYDVGLFFYAGHGLQVDGNNYLVPTDASLIDITDVEYNCVRADRVLGKMESSNSKTNIVILDACRDNPFERSWNRGVKGKGLAFMNAPAGSLIAYATSPGRTASDGTGKNGLYTEALLQHIGTTNLSIETIFKKVRNTVEENSHGEQIPWEATSLMGSFYFMFDKNLPAPNEEETPSQWIIITSEPEGGDLIINDQYVGQTPFQQEMEEGRYSYSLKKDLYHTETGQFQLIAQEGRKKIEIVFRPNFGFAKISSTPESGATVRIDGNIQPRNTPLETGMLQSGRHTVDVSKSMFHSASQSFDIIDGQTTEVMVNMSPNFGKLTINSVPEDGASISLNGQPTGELTPYTDERFSSGEYSVTLRKEWYETKTETFSVTDGENKVLNINLKPIFGEVSITTEPGSDIYVDGQLKGNGTYSGRLTGGLHTLEAKKEKYHDYQAKTEIVIGAIKEISMKLKPEEGTLKVIAKPVETRITLNGKDYGTTPQTIKNLAAGAYTLELSKDGYSGVVRQIEIADNEVTEINEELPAVIVKEEQVTETRPAEEKEGQVTESQPAEKEHEKKPGKEPGEISAGKIILMSAVLPGLGSSRLSQGKPYWLLGVGGYACIGTSIIFNKKAASSYDSYLDPVSIEQAGTDFDHAIHQQKISRGFAIAAGAIWVFDLSLTTIRVLKLKDRSQAYNGGSTLYIGYRNDPVNGVPMLSLNLVF